MFKCTATLLLIFLVSAAAQAKPEWLTDGQQRYLNGEYRRAAEIVKSQEAMAESLSEIDKAQFYLLKARLAGVENRAEDMRGALRRVFQVDPNTQLDVYLDTPPLFQAWEEIRKEALVTKKPEPTEERVEEDLRSQEIRKRTRFSVSLIPFGIGHISNDRPVAGLGFLAADFGLTYLVIDRPKVQRAGTKGQTLYPLGALTLLGAWGYEILDLMPQLIKSDAERAENVRYGLSFAPFGVGQWKNGEKAKAIGFALVEAGLWALATTGDGPSRTTSLGVVTLATIYGAYDAWDHHKSLFSQTPSTDHFAVYPHFAFEEHREYGIGMRWQW